MRTTVNIDDELLIAAKQLAARGHRSLGEVVNDALRTLMASPVESRRDPVRLHTYGHGWLRPGVDLDDKESLAELLDADEAAARAAG